jgi:predicted tellurium resistance membrane protein TerC
VYPVLVLVGIKLFAEDFPHGQPVTLFVALAFVGSALLLVAKLISQGDQQAVTSNESRQIDRTRP